MSPGSEWRIVHPNGYASPAYGELPSSLLRDSRGAVAVETDAALEQVLDVREWTGTSWRPLEGGDRDHALAWIETAVTGRKRGGVQLPRREMRAKPRTNVEAIPPRRDDKKETEMAKAKTKATAKTNETPKTEANGISTDDLATALGRTAHTLRGLRSRGTGPQATKIGGRVVYELENVLEWINAGSPGVRVTDPDAVAKALGISGAVNVQPKPKAPRKARAKAISKAKTKAKAKTKTGGAKAKTKSKAKTNRRATRSAKSTETPTQETPKTA